MKEMSFDQACAHVETTKEHVYSILPDVVTLGTNTCSNGFEGTFLIP